MSGMVKNPGPLAVYDNMRVSEVLDQAGGIASGASNRFVYIKRVGPSGNVLTLKADLFDAYRSKDLSKDIRIQAGDVIEVPNAVDIRISQLSTDTETDKLLFEGNETFVYVYGEVSRSGRFEYVPGKKISDYISYAGGPTSRALLNGVTLTRIINGKSEKLSINAADIIYNGKADKDIEIIGGDVINVPGNFFYVTDFTSFVNTILLTLTLYNTAKK
jgi:protein involved in polysaccharide export with SLBB domain